MDLSGLTSVTTSAEMQTWLAANCLSPINPVMTGTDFGVIMQKIIDVTGGGSVVAAGNGLTLNGSEIDLGGTLDQQTSIDLATNMFQFLSSGGGDYSTIYQQRLQPGALDDGGGIVEAAIGIEAAGPNGSSGIDMTSSFMNVGYFNQGKQNMISFSPDGVSFSSNDSPRAHIDSDGIFHIDNLNVTGPLSVGGSVSLPVEYIVSDYTLGDTDYKVMIQSTGLTDINIGLPDPTTVRGRVYKIQNMNPDAGTGTNGTGGGVLFNYDIAISDGQIITAGTGALVTGDMAIELQSDGTVWTGVTDIQHGQSSHGIPAGGTAGQILSKVDNADYNASWTNMPAGTFGNLGGAPGDNAALAAALGAKADLVSGVVPFSQLPATLSSFIDITYANLIAAMSAGALKAGSHYRINDYQTVHNIPNVSPAVLNTGPVEPLIVLAVSSNKIGAQAWSEQYPQDIIFYTTDNSKISGAAKGCILRRIDTVLHNDVCNDFRNVKYRRWKFNPPAFDVSLAYNQYAPVLYTDGAIYFVMKPGGFAAGTASTPSATSDDWAQAAPNNNYYMSRSGAASSGLVYTSNNSNQPIRNVGCPINQSDFIDSVVFPNYGPGFVGNTIDNGPGNLFDMVIFNANQSVIMKFCKFGCYATTTYYQSTFVLMAGYMVGVEFRNGLAFVLCILNGQYMSSVISEAQCYSATFNITQMYRVVGQFHYSFVRGRFANCNLGRAEFVVFPNNVRQLYSPFGIGNIKFMSNAEIRGLTLLSEFGGEYLAGDIFNAATASEQYVNYPLFWKTVVGSFADAYNVSGNLGNMLAKLKSRHIAYAYEDPAGKSIIAITNGQSISKTWQSDLTDINLADLSGNDGFSAEPSTYKYMTFFTKHGNDFQVQQKDLIAGVWTPNNSPAYTIDSVDSSGNVTQVTFHPNTTSGVTESRFVLI